MRLVNIRPHHVADARTVGLVQQMQLAEKSTYDAGCLLQAFTSA